MTDTAWSQPLISMLLAAVATRRKNALYKIVLWTIPWVIIFFLLDLVLRERRK